MRGAVGRIRLRVRPDPTTTRAIRWCARLGHGCWRGSWARCASCTRSTRAARPRSLAGRQRARRGRGGAFHRSLRRVGSGRCRVGGRLIRAGGACPPRAAGDRRRNCGSRHSRIGVHFRQRSGLRILRDASMTVPARARPIDAGEVPVIDIAPLRDGSGPGRGGGRAFPGRRRCRLPLRPQSRGECRGRRAGAQHGDRVLPVVRGRQARGGHESVPPRLSQAGLDEDVRRCQGRSEGKLQLGHGVRRRARR